MGGGSNGRGNGGGRDPGGGGGNGPDPGDKNSYDPNAFVPEKSRVLTGVLLVIVMMTFGGLTSAYIVIATNGAAEWHPFALPIQVWISTVILLASSVTYHFGWKTLDAAGSRGGEEVVYCDDGSRSGVHFIAATGVARAAITRACTCREIRMPDSFTS